MSASIPISGTYDKVFVLVPRAEVEGAVEAKTAGFLASLAATPESICEHFDQIVLVFEGYDADSREVWMIPEVCAFIQRSDAIFSDWGFFLATESIPAIARCLLGSEANTILPTPYISDLLRRVVERMFLSIGVLAERADFSDDQLQRRLSEVARVVLGVRLF